MAYNPQNPLIVQSDYSILIEVDNPLYEEARNDIVTFAELVKSPEHIHTYKITPLSIWNACATGHTGEKIVAALTQYAKYDVPEHIIVGVGDFASRYGRLTITRDESALVLKSNDRYLAEEIYQNKDVRKYIEKRCSETEFHIIPLNRGLLKQALIKAGFPAEDLAGYVEGESLPLSLLDKTRSGEAFTLRPYQHEASEIYYANGHAHGGSGVIVMPCGSGKTIIGMSCIAQIQSSTLILTTGVTAIRQWIDELLDKTTIMSDQVGEYSSKEKNVRPITVTTYQILTYRKRSDGEFEHLTLFDQRNWGLIIYDEVHTLPAPVFQMTASLQARRRLGLTATLVREDGREDDVFALIGPKKADIPWKVMEKQGWIAKACCYEYRIHLPESLRMPYALESKRQQFRIASENHAKIDIVKDLLSQNKHEKILIIGMYIDQLKEIAKHIDVPILTGSTPQNKRDSSFNAFKSGKISTLIVSKIANFAVDLPDASVAIQVSGTYGSRQEEAQRLGRILRPKKGENQAHFYTIISRDTVEQDFALNRQMFLCEQGYEYHIKNI